jgi:proton-dependent oligopeptide transporter, POT family
MKRTSTAERMVQPQASIESPLKAVPAVTESATSNAFPPGIPFIVGNEGAERFSFYGMKAILFMYMAGLYVRIAEQAGLVANVAEAEARGTQIMHLFGAGVYAFPLIGAILADRLLGKYNVIFWVSLIYCAGHGVLALAGSLDTATQYTSAEMAMYLGLGLIAVGSGGIKPCVSANVGDQFTSKNGHLVTMVYQIFYFIINFGSFFSTILTPILNKKYGPEVAFGVPGVLMAVATVFFWLGRKRFTRVAPSPGGRLGLLDSLVTALLLSPIFALIVGFFAGHGAHPEAETFAQKIAPYLPHAITAVVCFTAGIVLFNVRQRIQEYPGFLSVLLYSMRNQKNRKAGEGFFSVAEPKFGQEAAEGPAAVLRIMVVFSMVIVFWALFDQHASTWIKQASLMELGLDVPRFLGQYAFWGTIGASIYGAFWLFSWISNTPVPKTANRVILGVFAVTGVAALVGDLVLRQWEHVPLDAQQISAMNPLMVMVIIPLLNVCVYNPLKKRGLEVRPLQRMTAGMFLAAVAFGAAAFLQMRIESAAVSGDKVHVLWQAVQYFVMTMAEVLVSVTGLEFAYTQAPRAMKSTIMGFWLLCVTFGNILVAFLAPLQATFALSEFFWLFTGLMVAASVVFTVLAYFYKGKSYLQQAAAH